MDALLDLADRRHPHAGPAQQEALVARGSDRWRVIRQVAGPTAAAAAHAADRLRGGRVVVAGCFGLGIYGSRRASRCAGGASCGGRPPRLHRTGALYLNGAFEAMLAAGALFFLRRRGYAVGTLYPAPSWWARRWGLVLFGVSTWRWPLGVAIPFTSPDVDQPIQGMLDGADSCRCRPSCRWRSSTAPSRRFSCWACCCGAGARSGASTALGLMSLVRLLCHVYQGPAGAAQVHDDRHRARACSTCERAACGRWCSPTSCWDIVPFMAHGHDVLN